MEKVKKIFRLFIVDKVRWLRLCWTETKLQKILRIFYIVRLKGTGSAIDSDTIRGMIGRYTATFLNICILNGQHIPLRRSA